VPAGLGRRLVLRPAGPREDAEDVVPGRDDRAEAGDGQEEPGEGVSHDGAVAAVLVPAGGAPEREAGEDEDDDADADADGGEDGLAHFEAPGFRRSVGPPGADERSGGAVALHLDPLVVQLADAAVGRGVTAHEPGALLSAKTYAEMARTSSSVYGPPPRGGMAAGYWRGLGTPVVMMVTSSS
jgi:hypothetical protein